MTKTSKDTKQPVWRAKAACRGVDPDIFFPVTDEDAEDAKAICGQCPVQELCLDWAISTREKEGVWGGATERATSEDHPAPAPQRLAGLDTPGFDWPGLLGLLASGTSLPSELAGAAMAEVLEGNATPAQIAAFVFGLRCKGETVEEMAGMVGAMLAAAETVSLPPDIASAVVDTCGTGGDRSGTINVSTIAALVVAGAGVPVCKHGGRAASSKAGSADVLEALGVVIDLGPAGVARCVAEAGIGFCFAPRFHAAMRHAIPVRREIGVPTAFNFLGPLANPARVRRQVVGVGDPAMAPKMAGVLASLGATSVMVVHGAGGLDELSTLGSSEVHSWSSGELTTYTVAPADLGLAPATLSDLVGGDAAHNASLARLVLEGKPGAHRDIVVLNAAAALVVAGQVVDLEAGVSAASASIDSGAARTALERLVAVSHDARAGGA